MVAILLNPGMARTGKFRRTYIRQWRQARSLTLEQLAERLDMTASHLSMLERGERGYAQETLEAIARELQTDAGSLLSRHPEDEDTIWAVWNQAKPEQREMIVDIAKRVIKPRG